MINHIKTIENATVWYYDSGEETRYEGKMELHENWVKLCRPMATWVPRENVDMVMEG